MACSRCRCWVASARTARLHACDLRYCCSGWAGGAGRGAPPGVAAAPLGGGCPSLCVRVRAGASRGSCVARVSGGPLGWWVPRCVGAGPAWGRVCRRCVSGGARHLWLASVLLPRARAVLIARCLPHGVSRLSAHTGNLHHGC